MVNVNWNDKGEFINFLKVNKIESYWNNDGRYFEEFIKGTEYTVDDKWIYVTPEQRWEIFSSQGAGNEPQVINGKIVMLPPPRENEKWCEKNGKYVICPILNKEFMENEIERIDGELKDLYAEYATAKDLFPDELERIKEEIAKKREAKDKLLERINEE